MKKGSLLGYVVKPAYESIRQALIFRFGDMKRLEVFLPPLDGLLVHRRGGASPSIRILLPLDMIIQLYYPLGSCKNIVPLTLFRNDFTPGI